MESVHPNIDNRLPLFKLVHFNNAWKIEYVLIPTFHIQIFCVKRIYIRVQWTYTHKYTYSTKMMDEFGRWLRHVKTARMEWCRNIERSLGWVQQMSFAQVLPVCVANMSANSGWWRFFFKYRIQPRFLAHFKEKRFCRHSA